MPDRYAVIGNPIAHSKSPLIHAAFASATGHAMTYERLLAPLDGFAAAARRFASEGGLGLNVTAPFKLDAFALATEMSVRARSAGACNTLAWRGSHWFGDNTDGAGLIHDLLHNLGVAVSGRDVLIFGAGGAARGILGPLLAKNPRRVVIVNRTQSKAEWLAAHFAAQGNIAATLPRALGSARFDIVINATSIGLQANDVEGVWAAGVFAPNALAYDLIYADATTPFARWASANGAARTADGLGMLIEQAAESFLVWRGVRPDSAPIFPLLRPV